MKEASTSIIPLVGSTFKPFLNWLVKQSRVQISKCKNIHYPTTKSHLLSVECPPSLLDLGVEVILLSPNFGLNFPSVTIRSAFKRATC